RGPPRIGSRYAAGVSDFVFQVRSDAPGVTQSWSWRTLARTGLCNLGLTVGIQRVIEWPRQYEFFVIVGYGQLESADQCVQTGGLLAPRAAGWHVRVADDASHFRQRRIIAQTVSLQHHLERALVTFVAIFGAAHVERVPFQTGSGRVCIDEHELRTWID